MSAFPLIFTSGWASGINPYAVVLMLGLLGRYGHYASVPPTLERTDVLILAAALFLGQFVVGKIPYLDSAWDLAHTPIRPLIGGAIAILMANHAHGSLAAAVGAAAVGSAAALATHTIKTGVRMGVNASPEPLTNIAASIGEDLGVGGLVALALLHPLAAAVIACVLTVLGIVLVVALAKRIRRFWQRRRERRAGSLQPS